MDFTLSNTCTYRTTRSSRHGRILRGACVAFAALVGSTFAFGSGQIYSQLGDNQSQFGPSNVSLSNASVNGEAGDDFDMKASIDRIIVHGERWNFSSTTLPPISGAYVRFYSWSNGLPGPKQYEQFVPWGPALAVNTHMDNVSINLPVAFSATGKHFVTVQLKTDEGWYWLSSSSGAVKGVPGVVRDNLTAGAWTQANTSGAKMDGAFELYGTLTGTPLISGVSTPGVPRSGRFRIFGTNFGEARGTVTIGGLNAIVTEWNFDRITAYIPEASPLGADAIQVTTTAGISAPFNVNVLARQTNGRIMWRFPVDGPYTSSGAAIGPDGTIYISDAYGRLYALTPTGGLKWMTPGVGFYESIISVGADGTIYIGNDGAVTAVNPNGSVKWRVTDGGGWMMAGPNVGPDGNIYYANSGIRGGHGLVSLTPAGAMRWFYQGVNEYGPTQQNLSFGNGNVYAGFDQYGVDPQNAILGLRLTDGGLVFKSFAAGGENVDTAVGTNGDVYASTWAWELRGFTGTGTYRWSAFGPGAAISAPKVGPDGTIYVSSNLSHVFALNQNGSQKWVYNDDKIHDTPIADRQNTILVGSGLVTYGDNGFVEAFTTAGKLAWRVLIPAENPSLNYPGNIIPYHGVLTPDGATAYFGSTHPGQNEADEYTYLYAVQVKATTTTDNATVPTQTVPSSMTSGQSYSVVVNVTNTGTTTWTAAGGYRLACVQGTAWNKATVALATTDAIAPGQTKKFSFSVNAPKTVGTYPMQWRMDKVGVQFGTASPLLSIPVTVRQHAALYVSQSQPLSVKAGSNFTVSVTMQNVGTSPWTKAAGFMLASTSPDLNITWGSNTVAMLATDTIPQGANKTFTFNCKAPTTPGTYTMRWRMYRSALAFTGFFGDLTTSKTLTVTP